MEYATIVSVFPFPTTETKPGMANGNFHLPAAKENDFILFHVAESFYTVRLPATDQHINVPVSAKQLAKSIVLDFIGSHIASDAEARPGMFWLDGKLDKLEIATRFKDLLENARVQQKRWFLNLVRLADDDWNRYHQQGLISDHQRYAAKALDYDAPWLVKYDNVAGTKDCPVCYTKIDERAAKCPQCQAVLNKKIVDMYTSSEPETKAEAKVPEEIVKGVLAGVSADIKKGK